MSARDEAKKFLVAHLAGGPQSVRRVKDWARNKGISEKTLRRAKKDLGIVTQRQSDGQWYWSHVQVNQIDHAQLSCPPAQFEDAQGAQVELTPTCPESGRIRAASGPGCAKCYRSGGRKQQQLGSRWATTVTRHRYYRYSGSN